MGNLGRAGSAPGSRPFGCRLSSRGVNASQALDLPLLSEGLERLEPLLTSTVVTGDSFLDSVTTHLIAAGGKRLRPLLALAAATGGENEATREDLLGAVAVSRGSTRCRPSSRRGRSRACAAFTPSDDRRQPNRYDSPH